MRKIIHIITTLDVGGAESMLKRLAIETKEYPNYKQLILNLSEPGKNGMDLSNEGIEVINLKIKSFLYWPIRIYKLINIIRKEQPLAVYTWMYHADLIGGMASYIAGIRNIIWGIRCTNVSSRSIITKILIRVCSLLSYVLPRVIICCSHSAKKTHESIGYCSKKMKVISNGYNLKNFNPDNNIKNKIKKNLGLSGDSKIIGTVGNFNELKDFNNFIKAASIAAENYENVYFFMIGRGLDRQNNQLMNWINKSKIQHKFFLFGQTDPHDLYAAMDFYCLSSKSEGFPNVVAEAMAMKTPCIVTDVGDAKIIVNNIGEVVPPNNSNELGKGFIKMLSKPNFLVTKMGEDARHSISKNYNIVNVTKEFLNVSYYS